MKAKRKGNKRKDFDDDEDDENVNHQQNMNTQFDTHFYLMYVLKRLKLVELLKVS